MEVLDITGPAGSKYSITTVQTDVDPNNWTATMYLEVSGTPVTGWNNKNVKGMSVSAVADAITALGGGWTGADNEGAEDNHATRAEKAVAVYMQWMATVPLTACNTLQIASLNQNKFWYAQLAWAKYDMETRIGSGYDSYAYCASGASQMTADLKTYVTSSADFAALGINPYRIVSSTSSYTTANKRASYTAYSDYTSGTGPTAGLQILEIGLTNPISWTGTTSVAGYTDSWSSWLRQIGGVNIIVFHDLTSVSLANVQTIIDRIVSSGMTIMSFKDFYNSLTPANGWTDAGGGIVWTRVPVDLSDYHLSSVSPAINAGTVVVGLHDQAGCVDYEGNTCYNVKFPYPDIGAYAYQKKPILRSGTGPAFTLGTGAGIQGP
jgi:hypothetical protein